MNWNKSITLPDGSTLSGNAAFGRTATVSFTLTPRNASAATYRHRINFFNYHNWGNSDFFAHVSSDVWEEMFKHYEHVCRHIPVSDLTDWQRSLFETRVERVAGTPSPLLQSVSLAAQAFALITGKSSMLQNGDYLYTMDKHTRNLPEVTDVKSAFYYLNPRLTPAEENLAVALKGDRMGVPEDLHEYFAVASLALSTQNPEVLKLKLRDMAEVSDFDRKQIFGSTALDFPLRASKFRNYLLDLSGEDFQKLVGKIPKSASATSAITIAERVLQPKEEVAHKELYTSAQEKYTPVFQHLLALENPEFFSVAYEQLMKEALRPQMVDVVQAFFLNLAEKDMKGRHNGVRHRLEQLFGEGTSSWVTPKTRAADIMETLVEVLPADRVVITIEEVIGEKQPLTAAQWEKFAKEVDTYKDLQVSWWKPLVKNVRNKG